MIRAEVVICVCGFTASLVWQGISYHSYLNITTRSRFFPILARRRRNFFDILVLLLRDLTLKMREIALSYQFIFQNIF